MARFTRRHFVTRTVASSAALWLVGSALGDESRHVPQIDFVAESPEFEAAAEEYRAIWSQEGDQIAAALEAATGLRMESGPIRAIVFEGVSNSGYGPEPMHMRASYPLDTKRATLVHELSHRLVSPVVPERVEQHPIIFLFLYDVWVDLWGKEFADAQVAVESERRGIYDYEKAWRDALALNAAERAERWSKYVAEQRQ